MWQRHRLLQEGKPSGGQPKRTQSYQERQETACYIDAEEKKDLQNIVNIINNNEIDSVPEKISTKELYEEEEKIDEPVAIEKQEAKIEDDFFDLVDSMYKERNDE